MKRALAFVTTVALVLPAMAAAATPEEEEFDPAHEWEMQEWVPIHIGPLDMSINKAVAYLMLGAIVSIVLGIVLMRVRLGERPGEPPDHRRDHLRGRAGAGGRAGPADEGARTAGSPMWPRSSSSSGS